jgi:outer membrane lipoprotein-sorting protein
MAFVRQQAHQQLHACRRNEDDDAKEDMYAFVTVPKDQSVKGKQTAIVDEHTGLAKGL